MISAPASSSAKKAIKNGATPEKIGDLIEIPDMFDKFAHQIGIEGQTVDEMTAFEANQMGICPRFKNFATKFW